jgi:hypothetical protein
MKKINLKKRLSAYSKLAGVAVAAAPLTAQGEIVYTDVEPDSTLGVGDVFEVDFNSDGVVDMVVGIGTATGTYGGQPLYFQAAFASGDGAGSFAGSLQVFGGNNFYFPEAYNAGANLDETLAWQAPSAFGSMNYVTSIGGAPAYSGGNWENQNDKYLAVRFTAAGNQHYGWIRMSIGAAGTSNFITVKGYAFEAVPDEGIEAGAESGGVVPSGLGMPDYSESFNCYSFGGTLFVQSLDAALQDGHLEVFNAAGQSVHRQVWNQGSAAISLQVPEGIYFVRIRVADGYANRKVFLSSGN